MFKSAHLAAVAGFFGLAAAAFTVDLAGPRAESPLQFLLKQNRAREAPPQHSYQDEPLPVRRNGGFFEELFEFDNREAQPRSQTPPVSANLQRVVCKRRCDGAQLVMGFMPAKSRQKEAEAMCAAAGGGAPTQLVLEKFVPGRGFDPVETASNPPLQEGRASLDANAAQPRTAPSPANGGCPQTDTRDAFMMIPILHDATLRNGDVVATKSGFKVFVGSGKPPFKEKDFVPLDKRKKIASDLRKLKVAGN
jgi:hypothetical protein